jgi:hypothetical protein
MEDNRTEIILYETPDGKTYLEVLLEGETVWLTQAQMVDLFKTTKQNISLHTRKIFEEGELIEDAVVKYYLTTAADGRGYRTKYYNLDVIISVGYRVKSPVGTQFRIWANKVLRELIIKGFVLDDERLKHGKRFGRDYFDELLERIREIRASERRFYQKITDIFANCSIDYDSKSITSQTFYSHVQNKLHWAITHHTAAELIAERADSKKPAMGLQTWKNAPKGKIVKSDVSIAKNYLTEKEIKELERIVSMYLDYAENQAERQIPMTMAEWAKKLDAFLQFNEYEILKDAGKIKHDLAVKLAEKEYRKFRVAQDRTFESDFDRVVKKFKQKKKDSL